MPRCVSTSVASARVKDRDEVTGTQTRVKVVKNKLAPPFKQVEFDIMYGEGVSKTGELIDLGVKAGGGGEVGCLVLLQFAAPRPGARECQAVPQGQSEMANEIELSLRQNAGLIAEKFLENGGPGGLDERRW